MRPATARGRLTPHGVRYEVICEGCGRRFEAARSHARTCSPTCRKRVSDGRRFVSPEALGDGPLILSLCDYSGSWSEPYREQGYRVVAVDLERGQDVRLLPWPGEVHGILAAPPCTAFCRAAAWRWEAMPEAELLDALAVVDACLRLVATTRPSWWALENPPGRLERWLGPPAMLFQPWHYGDAWTKETALWGSFCGELVRSEVEAACSWVGKVDAPGLRAQTPGGFARAFAAANP